MPIPEIDWGRREEDDFFSRTKDVLTRTENCLKSKNVVTPNPSGKSSKDKSKKAFKKKKSYH